MDWKQPRGKQPESVGAERLVTLMVSKGWICDKVGGGKFTKGWPDYFCWHPVYGLRWVETKVPEKGKLRASQIKRFSRWQRKGLKVYICFDETDYEKLFKNWSDWENYV